MMTELFLIVLEVSASVGSVVLLLLLLSPFLNRRYASKWKYLIWIFLAVRLLIPFSGADGRSAVDMALDWKERIVSKEEQNKADIADAPAEAVPRRIVVEIPERMTAPLEAQNKKSITLLDISALIWMTGSLLFIAVHMVSYLHYKRQVMKNGRVIKEAIVLQQLLKIKRELHIRHIVPVIEYSGAVSPMVLGFFRPVLVLPDEKYSAEELFFILKHELVHVKRGDVYWKLLFVLANGLHWFNPLIWVMQREAAVDMELSCDERVTGGADLAAKKAYTETLLSTLHKGCGKRIVLSTGFYGGKQIMKKRFRNILRKTGKKNGFSVLAFAVVLTVSMGTLVGCSVVKENMGESSDAERFAQMAGSWVIDFERTDPNIWGTGISFGDEMEISESGEFSYYIGITAGGTGQCEEDNGEISVEIEPYEAHSEEKEILTLKYENDGGTEYILMDWYGERVYWKRSTQSEEEIPSENLPAEESIAEDTITLTIMKEGIIEEKQATLVVDDEGFSFYLPDGEWQRKGAALWYAVENEDVMLWVAVFEGGYPIEQILINDNYVPDGVRMTKDEEGLRHKARLYEAEDKVWLVEYCYPVEAEEGWGSELAVIADTFAVISENSELILGYITDFGGGTVTIDRQDWVVPGTPDWKPEYDLDAGFEIVDLEGEDIVYPVSSDCKYFILENHQGESMELDAEAFEKYWRETEFPIFWSADLVDGEVVSFAEWYRP